MKLCGDLTCSRRILTAYSQLHHFIYSPGKSLQRLNTASLASLAFPVMLTTNFTIDMRCFISQKQNRVVVVRRHFVLSVRKSSHSKSVRGD
jgi:hypothetical protein